MQDPLSAALTHARVEAAFFARALGAPPWGVETRGAASGIFHVVVRGRATLRLGEQVIPVEAGEIVVLAAGPPHVLCDPATARSTWIGALPRLDEGLPTVIAGDGEPETEILCGTLRFGELGQELVVANLPPVLHARGPALGAWVRALAEELRRRPPGADAVASCLGELLFLLALREWLDSRDAPGWLAGLVHPEIGRVLAMVQAAPGEDWSLDRLARKSGMSRSTFCERFQAVVGEAPAAWVTGWRMVVARELLRDPNRSIAEVAAAVGYSGEAAFHRAFKRTIGQPPATWRRELRAPEAAPGAPSPPSPAAPSRARPQNLSTSA